MSQHLSLHTNEELENKTKNHPCYSGRCQNARIHLPVAPACNISCNYCNRKFDCVNESRPGVTSEVLNPAEAFERFKEVKSNLTNLKVVGIAGPGDALANFAATKKTLKLIREADPDITFCLSTNGLMLPYYADDLLKLGVTHVTVTINTIDPKIGAKIYGEVNFLGQKLTGEPGAKLLLENQLAGLKLLVSLGIVVKVNVVMIKGINDTHIEDVVKTVKDLGVYISNIMPLIPAPGSVFETMPLTTNTELTALRKKCELHLKQMYHCRQCRADAIGSLDNDCSVEFRKSTPKEHPQPAVKLVVNSYSIAVASHSGRIIDEHFGHAKEFSIYHFENGTSEFIEKRPVDQYCKGPSDCGEEIDKLDGIINTISDCHAVLVLRIGHTPKETLEKKGIRVIQTCGLIEEELEKLAMSI